MNKWKNLTCENRWKPIKGEQQRCSFQACYSKGVNWHYLLFIKGSGRQRNGKASWWGKKQKPSGDALLGSCCHREAVVRLNRSGLSCNCLEVHIWLFPVGPKLECEVTQLCPTLCDPMDCSLWGSSIHGIFQARLLEWVAISFSRGSSWPGSVPGSPTLQAVAFTIWATREVP